MRIPAVRETEDALVVRHEIDDEFAKSHTTYDLVLRGNREPLPEQLFFQLYPLAVTGQVDDEIDIICQSHVFQRDRIGDEECRRTSADKHKAIAQIVPDGLGHGFEHVEKLPLDGHLFRSLCLSRSTARLDSRCLPSLMASTSARYSYRRSSFWTASGTDLNSGSIESPRTRPSA